MSLIDRALRIGEGKKFKQFEKQVELVNAFEPEMELLEDEELATEFAELRERAQNGEKIDDLLPHSFALTREAGKRTMNMRHFDVQLIGGMVLHHGDIAEMKTGEGKTLTATLPVVLNTLKGEGVHVVTVNDYLAKRDAEWMAPIYEMLGLSIGILQSDEYDWNYKRAAYEADITYGTNSEFGFDYLRDNIAHSREEQVQRGQKYAIVDEVDNILIDEARTPLIISGQPEQAADYYKQFAKLAKQMVVGEKPKEISAKDRVWVADFDYEADEKYKTVSITELGVAKAEKFLGIENLYLAETGTLVNHLIQALKAESLYMRDIDYSVIDGEVKIIDEYTGRILEGRRWSEGLHQAIEAKEGVAIQEENQTVATVTYQNYFRRYDKLAGMTGTALTEATEFMKIYELQVVEIPTNREMIRLDKNDQIYKTKEGKWSAIEREILARHEAGQPILVGTISVETSEQLSKRLKKNGVPHEVLNAKPEYAEREAETIAQAGRPGAVTIATNMAGRGVDIKLGGNAEELAHHELQKRRIEPETEEWDAAYAEVLPQMEERVEAEREKALEAGGLYVCGTERHESRRIDNQLRGRSGRQGDPGETRFFLSAEDDLVRLFAGDRIYKILDRLGGVDDEGNEEPIEAGILSKQIEGAQKKVEEQNYLSRKRVLEYDDVMNQQREVIYEFRDNILEGADMSVQARESLHGVIERLVADYTQGDAPEHWDIVELFSQIDQIFPISFGPEDINVMGMERHDLVDTIAEEAVEAYEEKEEELTPELLRDLERHVLLEIIDERWREHLNDMDYLREGIHLRGFAEVQPIIAYKNEGFTMFGELMDSIWDEFARVIYHYELTDEGQREQARKQLEDSSKTSNTQQFNYTASDGPNYGVAAAVAANMAESEIDAAPALADAAPGVIPRPARTSSTAGGGKAAPAGYDPDGNPMSRNQPCYCGSGKKFKNCHGK
ncbi:MAG: preprotein translocase subunit SecA [Thermoleophilaceae bacterium]|nr:preprotein translocase subunit SecA [Thermoleophilaceae bacterium]